MLTHAFERGSPTGVGRYATEIVRSVHAAAPDRGWTAEPVSPEGAVDLGSGIRTAGLPGPRRALNAALAAGLPVPIDRLLRAPAVVHQLNPWVPLRSASPLLLTVHDLMPMHRPDWYSIGFRFRFRRALDRAARDGWLICNSEYVAEQCRARLPVAPDHIFTVPMGVQDRFRSPVTDDEVARVCTAYGLERNGYVLALGVMSSREDPRVVVDALTRCRVELGERALVATGPDRHGARSIRDRLAHHPFAARVHVTGFVPDADLPALLRGAAALVHPSRDEGFGFTPLEAMAVGTPVIASRAGALPETAGDGAVLVDPDAPDEWTDALEWVLTDTARRNALVERGLAHQAHFTWERTAERTLDVYDAIASGTSA